MEKQTKLLIAYLMLFIVVFSVVGFIEDIKTYLQVSIPVMLLLGILIGVYMFLEKKKNKDSKPMNKKHS